jgi:hypothetical protein
MTTPTRILLLIVTLTAGAGTAAAQSRPAPLAPSPVLEGALGWAGFGDEGVIHHTLIGTAVRFHLSRRFSVGPELTYMVGPGDDRDLIVTGNVMFDVLAPTGTAPRRATPFLVVGGGLFRHTDRFQSGTFSSTEGAFTLGLGARVWATRRTFVAVDARLGWEPHLRVAATVGVALAPD